METKVARRSIAFALLALLSAMPLLAADPSLLVEHSAVHVADDGAALPLGYRYRPGDTVYFDFQVSGYQQTEDREIRLAWRIDVADPQGIPLVEPSDDKLATRLSEEDRHWMPIGRRDFTIPAYAPGGRYRILLNVGDALAKSAAKAETFFDVDGPTGPPLATLTIRRFRFLRSEDDTEALDIPAYRPGDTLWARFEMAGYHLGPGNHFALEYGLRILRSDGSLAFEQPHAARAEDSSFYPQRSAPGVLSLHMPPDLAKGEYTLVLAVTDDTGNQAREMRQRFSVE